jgi:hypothetical protein
MDPMLSWENESKATIEITLEQFIKFQKLYTYNDIYKFLPIPASIQFVSRLDNHDIIIVSDHHNNKPKVSYMVQISFEYNKCNDIQLIQELFDNIKDIIEVRLYQHMSIFLEKDGHAYLNPFQLTNFGIDNMLEDISNEVFDGTYWSAHHKHDKHIIDIYEDVSGHDEISFAPYPKYNLMNLFGTTSVLKKYKLSDFSINKLKQYDNLIYKFQDGHTHIWMNNEVVVKLSFMRILAEHEASILKLNIEVLPTLIDTWSYDDEFFIIMKNCGQPPTNLYGFSCLIPPSIDEQKQQIKNKLDEYGLTHLDDHACNYVLLDNKLTIIDCELIVDSQEFDKYKSDPNFIPTKYPKEYYKRIYSTY